MRKNIVLIGMMGCGKTTIGTLLAKKLYRELVDTDVMIEEKEGCSIPEIFAAKGEGYFRELERSVAVRLGGESGLVIACGGGLPLREDCIAPLKENGVVVWLRRDPGESYDGLDVSGRPLAQQGRQAFVERFEQRSPIYRRWADVVIDEFSAPEVTLNAVLKEIER